MKATLAAVVAALALAAPAHASPGELDQSFGDGGVTAVTFPFSSTAGDAVEQPDGKLVVVGQGDNNNGAIARYNPDGTLDQSFGTDGRILVPLGGFIGSATAVSIDPTSKILVVGWSGSGPFSQTPPSSELLRYDPDGSLDASFGDEGILRLPCCANRMQVQPNGRILIESFGPTGGISISRMLPDGGLDPSFGSNGRVDVSAIKNAGWGPMALAPDGKIVLAGQIGDSTAAAIRFNPDGSVDGTFGSNGVASAPLDANVFMNAVDVASDGGVVIAGSSGLHNQVETFVRFLPNGSADGSFGNGGVVTNGNATGPPTTEANAVTIQPDGKILAAGDQADRANGRVLFLLTRLNADGSLDGGFGTGGNVTTALGGASNPDDVASDLVLRPDGTFVAVGSGGSSESCGAGCTVSIGSDFGLAGYQPNGALNGSFGTGGTAMTDFAPQQAQPDAVTADRAGHVDLAGSVSGFGIETPALAHLNTDGSLDASWEDGGRSAPSFATAKPSDVETAAVQGDGTSIVAGSEATAAKRRALAVQRYTPAGRTDPSFAQGAAATARFRGTARAASLGLQHRKVVVDGPLRSSSGTTTALARYKRDGSLDRAFGHRGKLVLAKRYVGRPARHGLLPARKGRIVIVGSHHGFRLTELKRDGSIDRSFGKHGRVRTDFGKKAVAQGALAAGRGVVVYGRVGRHIALARYKPDGSLDRGFGKRGKTVSSLKPFAGSDVSALRQRGGRIVLAGTARGRFALARFKGDGRPDRSFGSRGRETSSVQGVATAVAPASHGKVLVAGGRRQGGRGAFVVARFDAASAQRHADLAAAKRRRHRGHPPNAVPALYVNASNFNELKRFAASDACQFARSQPKRAKRTLILDFGGARAYKDGSFGAAVNNAAFKATNQQIRQALRSAADAYAACHKQGRATIAYAVTNHFDTLPSALRARQIGVHQASTVSHVGGYMHGAHYAPTEHAGVAGDIETPYWGPRKSKAMVNGAKSVRRHGYMDFGTAGGCPPYLKGQRRPKHHKCFNGWTLDDVAHVSNAGGGEPLPEVYYRGGRYHYDQAAQWSHVAHRWNSKHATAFSFFGATGSTEFSSLTPGASWMRLKHKTPGHVGREVVNFKQDHWKPVRTPRHSDAAGP